MTILTLHIDDATLERLTWFRSQHAPDRTIEDLAEAAIAEAALRVDDRRPRFDRPTVDGGRVGYDWPKPGPVLTR